MAFKQIKHPLNVNMKRIYFLLDKMIGYPEVIENLNHELKNVQKYCGMEKDVNGDYVINNVGES